MPDVRALAATDFPGVVEVHMEAFPASALSQLGAEGVRRYYDWQMKNAPECVALGVFPNQALRGFCFAGVFHGALSGFLARNKTFLVWRVISHPQLLAGRLFRDRLALACRLLTGRGGPAPSVPGLPDRSFGILAIAVSPREQGTGIGKLLMEECEHEARNRGYRAMHLSVSPANAIAIAFYERLGWQRRPATDGKWYGLMTKALR